MAGEALGLITVKTQEDWIKHFVDWHKQMPGAPSPDEIRKYPAAFIKMFEDHLRVHRHFYVGHEHRPDGLVVVGRTK